MNKLLLIDSGLRNGNFMDVHQSLARAAHVLTCSFRACSSIALCSFSQYQHYCATLCAFLAIPALPLAQNSRNVSTLVSMHCRSRNKLHDTYVQKDDANRLSKSSWCDGRLESWLGKKQYPMPLFPPPDMLPKISSLYQATPHILLK